MAFGSQNSAALNVASQAGIITKGKDIFDSSHNCGREMGFELMGDLNRPGFFRHLANSLRNAFQTLPVTADC